MKPTISNSPAVIELLAEAATLAPEREKTAVASRDQGTSRLAKMYLEKEPVALRRFYVAVISLYLGYTLAFVLARVPWQLHALPFAAFIIIIAAGTFFAKQDER